MRKLRLDLEKAKKAKDLLEQRIPTLEGSIDDMKSLVDKFSSDSQREIKRREIAERKMEALNEKLAVWTEVHSQLQIDDPVRFKEDFDFVRGELTKMKKQMAERQKTADSLQSKLRQKEEKRVTKETKIVGVINTVRVWIAENLSIQAVKKFTGLTDKERDRELSKLIFDLDLGERCQLGQACL